MAERIIDFDGRRISVPVDATDDEVAAILDSTPAPAAPASQGNNDPTGLLGAIMKDRPAAQAVAPQPTGSTVLGAGTQFARGARSGLANILGLPVDAVNNAPRLANLLPGVSGVGPISDRPFMGSEYIDQQVLGLGGAIPEPPKPQGMAERVARRFGEEAGASAVPVAGGLIAASRIPVQAARDLPPLARMFVEPAAVAPGKFVQGNAAGAAMAATGASVANELTGNINKETGTYDPGLTDLLGAVGGVGAGSTVAALARPVGTAVSAVFNRPQFIDGVVKQTAAEEIARAAGVQPGPKGIVNTDPLVDQIMQGRRIGDTVPGYTESLADRTRNPGLAAMEYGRQTGENSGVYAQMREQNIKAVDNAMQATKPQESPAAFRSELEVRRDQALQDAIMRQQQAAQEAEQAVAPITPQTTPAQRGNVIREGLTEARDAARAQTEAAYQEANVAGKKVDPVPLTEGLDAAYSKLTEVERGLVPSGVIDRVRKLGVPEETGPVQTGLVDQYGAPLTREPTPPSQIQLREATTLKSELQRLQSAALADPRAENGGRNAARVLGQMIDQVDTFITSNLSPEELAKLNAARTTRFNEAEAFGRQGDPVQRVLAEYQGGQPRVSDERVPSLFTTPETIDGLFSRAKTPAMERALQEEILSRANTARADTIERFRADYARQIEKFPGLDDQLAVAQRARQMETEANTATANTMRDLGTADKPGAGTVGRFLQYGPEKADQAMATVMSSKDPARAADELIAFVGNDAKAVEGARRAFWDHMERKTRRSGETTATPTGTQPWMQGALKRFLDDPANAAVAQRLYKDNPEHLQRIREIADALQGTETRNFAKAPNTSGTAQALNPSNLPTAETIASRVFAVERGVVSPGFAALNVVGIMARKATKAAQVKAVNMAIDKALTDPDWAAQLLKENNPANRAALAKGARAWMGNQASTLINMMDDTEEDPIVKKAMER